MIRSRDEAQPEFLAKQPVATLCSEHLGVPGKWPIQNAHDESSSLSAPAKNKCPKHPNKNSHVESQLWGWMEDDFLCKWVIFWLNVNIQG